MIYRELIQLREALIQAGKCKSPLKLIIAQNIEKINVVLKDFEEQKKSKFLDCVIIDINGEPKLAPHKDKKEASSFDDYEFQSEDKKKELIDWIEKFLSKQVDSITLSAISTKKSIYINETLTLSLEDILSNEVFCTIPTELIAYLIHTKVIIE